jgi:hypothetical protein
MQVVNYMAFIDSLPKHMASGRNYVDGEFEAFPRQVKL